VFHNRVNKKPSIFFDRYFLQKTLPPSRQLVLSSLSQTKKREREEKGREKRRERGKKLRRRFQKPLAPVQQNNFDVVS
jgi:hypothetical protein